jgi:hypothetical protein
MSIKYNGKTIAGNYKVSASTTASDTKAGPIKIATEQELKDTTNNKVAVTPYLLNKVLNSINRGLKIGRIGIGFINESQQQERYLNGQVIIQDQFESFTTWVKDLIKLYPNLSCTDEEFETACSMSAYGQCGKFVVNDNAGSIRLPKVVNVQGLFDLTQAGLTVEAGLPAHTHTRGTMNITGCYGAEFDKENIGRINGAFYATEVGSAGWGNEGENGYTAYMDASRSWTGSTSNPNYTNNIKTTNTVQQEAVQYPYWIQVATGAETSVDVTREIELNIPYSLGDSKYSPRPLNNSSWLKSAGQWNSKALYPSYYDWILANVNGGVEGFVLSTATYTDYDYVVNTADETFRLPLLDGSETLPSDRQEILSFNADATYYVSKPVNGFYSLLCRIANQGVGVSIKNQATQQSARSNASYTNTMCAVTMFVPANNQVGLWKSALATTNPVNECYFIPAQGNGSLYFYVGETVQNANLINAGRIEEKVASLIPDNSSLISGYAMPSGKYIDLTLGASNTEYTAPANGYFAWFGFIKGTVGYFNLVNKTHNLGTQAYSAYNSDSGIGGYCFVPTKKGDNVCPQYYANTSITTTTFRFIYAVGSESEAQ